MENDKNQSSARSTSGTTGSGVSAGQFISDSISELKKVHSPTRAETMQATMVTLMIMLIVSVVLFFFDLILKKLMAALLVG